ncbi:MAG: ADOP family duplicated permease [Gemmatimonas sp.]
MMRILHAGWNRVRQLLGARRFEREMRAEMEAHIEQQAELFVARGMSRSDAYAAARRDFGNVSQLQHEARDARGVSLVEDTSRDLKYAVRSLLRTPGFTVVAVLSLTLGIAVNTAMLSFMRYFFSPARVDDPGRYVEFRYYITHPTWRALDADTGLYSVTAASSSATVAVLQSGAAPTQADVGLVNGGYFRLYGSRAHLGRTLVVGEERETAGAPPAVLSFAYWQRAFGSDSSIIGQSLRLANGAIFTVVGVAMPQFAGADRRVPDFWIPLHARLQLSLATTVSSTPQGLEDTDRKWIAFAGRIAPGVTFAQAKSRTSAIFARSGTSDTSLAREVTASLTRGSESGLTTQNVLPAALIFSATISVLLIGCANVANLLLARGMRRRREMAVRMSLGASRMRLIRQLVVESVLLAFIGSVLAMAASSAVLRVVATSQMIRDVSPNISASMLDQMRPDAMIVALTLMIALVSALAAGLLPALRSTQIDLSSATRDDGATLGAKSSRSRLRSVLVGGQVALSLVLLISASVLLHSARNALVLDVGFDREHLLTTMAQTQQSAYTQAQRVEFGKQFAERIALQAGPENVARGSVPTQVWSNVRFRTAATPHEGKGEWGQIAFASHNYFTVLGIDIVRGRSFTEAEARDGQPVVVVSQATAARLWPNQEAIGQPVVLSDVVPTWGDDSVSNKREARVIGVASDAQILRLGVVPTRLFYAAADSGEVLTRLADPSRSIARFREAARLTDPNVAVDVQTMDSRFADGGAVQGARITALYTATLGTLALLLSVVGIFGVVAYAVSQRYREIGVRMAIGARRQDVLLMVVRQGMKPVVAGALVGALVAAGVTHTLRAMLFGISAIDPIGYVSAACVVTIAAALACYIPARRAASIDPVSALRSD